MPGSARGRAGCDDDVFGRIGTLSLDALRNRVLRLDGWLGRRADDDLAGFGELRLTPDHVHLVLLHQEGDAAVQPRGDAARAGNDILDVGGDLAFEGQAVVLGMVGMVENFGGAQQRLGRNAAPVEADPAQMLPLDDRRLQAQLRRTNGGHVSARTRTDNDNVVILSHVFPTFGQAALRVKSTQSCFLLSSKSGTASARATSSKPFSL